MPYVFLVRHAQPDFAGDYDSITELGRRQSEWLGEHFRQRGLRFERTFCGSLRRQADTLAGIAAAIGSSVVHEVDPRLNEYDASSLIRDFAAGTEQALRAAGDRRAYFAAVREALLSWASAETSDGRSESWSEFGVRARAALAHACHGLGSDARVLIVTSGGIIGRLVADTLGAGAESAIQLNLQTRNTGISEIAVGRSASRVVSFNAVPHLERADRVDAITHS
ncbi:MAG TPA: histidine phosphatase family protein [Steroidobacteraceae bacterium]|nr:histidine phosphatase family protein [Steroidobacteraceae bacterium]